jgi:hypothetical protein
LAATLHNQLQPNVEEEEIVAQGVLDQISEEIKVHITKITMYYRLEL